MADRKDDSIDSDLRREVLASCEHEYAEAFSESYLDKYSFSTWVLNRWTADFEKNGAVPEGFGLWPPEKRLAFRSWEKASSSNAAVEADARSLYTWCRKEFDKGLNEGRRDEIIQRLEAFRKERGMTGPSFGGAAVAILWTIEHLLHISDPGTWRRASPINVPPLEDYLLGLPMISELDRLAPEISYEAKSQLSGFVKTVLKEKDRPPLTLSERPVELTARLIAIMALLADVDPAIWDEQLSGGRQRSSRSARTPKAVIKELKGRVLKILNRIETDRSTAPATDT